LKEIKSILDKSHRYGEEVWREIIKEVDVNQDGVIDLQEFISMMLNIS
jgi:Ca2+-binding EF-hand superfamily protein